MTATPTKLRLLVTTSILSIGTLLGASAHAQEARILETGSSLLYPLFNLWVPAYTKAHHVEITTQSTGSGTGISQAISGVAQIGASDAYLRLAISSQMINYNIPGLTGHLKLSGPVLAAIYQGKITKWNDPEIAKLNTGMKLPDNAIVPIHRTDGSGDTFIFTQFLSDSTPDWQSSLAYGTTISWPTVQGGIGAEGNQGMVNALQQTPYSIAYVGISFKDAVDQAKLGEAELENKSGKFVLPDNSTVQAAAAAVGDKTPADESISLIFEPGDNAYPIINYEYAIVNSKMAEPQAKEVHDFLRWAVETNGGSAHDYLEKVNFIALPASVRALSEKQINEIGHP
jgi:phosphate transport system substrate-binding protein